MKKIRIILFIFCFCLDVRTHASSSPPAESAAHGDKSSKSHAGEPHKEDHHEDVVEEPEVVHVLDEKESQGPYIRPIVEFRDIPEGCIKQSEETVCVVQNNNRRSGELKTSSASVLLYSGATLTRVKENLLRLVKGKFWFQAERTTVLQTVYGDIEVRPNTIVWIERAADRVRVRTHRGLILLQLKGDSRFYEIPSGFETSVYPVGIMGKAQMATPEPLEPMQHLREMRIAFPRKSDFKKEMLALASDWKIAQSRSSALHAYLVTDQLTERKRMLEAQARYRSGLQKERQKYRSQLLEHSER